jgi:glucokinase
MEMYYGKPVPPGQGAKYIFERAERAQDQSAIRAIAEAAKFLAAGIGSVLELIDPQIVVIGGGIAAGCSYLPTVRSKLTDYVSDLLLEDMKVEPAQLGNDAGMIGAALLCAGDV